MHRQAKVGTTVVRRLFSTGQQNGGGYKSIGSFHSDDIEELRRLPEARYTAPASEVDLSREQAMLEDLAATVKGAQGSDSCFGAKLKQRQFMIDPSWTFVNHGAFGGALRMGFTAAQAWQNFSEEQPLRYFDRFLLPNLTHSLRGVASFVKVDPTDMVLLPNATTGLNAVLRQPGLLKPKDRIFMFDTTYGSVKVMAKELCSRHGAVLDLAPVPLPLPTADPKKAAETLLECVERYLQPNTALAIFDHTTSNTAINMPLSELVAAARGAGARHVLVDGAHGLLAHDIDPLATGADFYVSNCHKWMSSPKGAAFMWSRDRWANESAATDGNKLGPCPPLVISHGFGQGQWSGFAWDGCRDYSAALSLPTVLSFWDTLGAARSREYMRSLLVDAVSLLQGSWGGDMGGGELICPLDMHGPMALVSLPFDRQGDATSTDAKRVQDALHFDHRVECPVKCVEGKLYVRISVHVYNELADYDKLAVAGLQVLRR